MLCITPTYMSIEQQLYNNVKKIVLSNMEKYLNVYNTVSNNSSVQPLAMLV